MGDVLTEEQEYLKGRAQGLLRLLGELRRALEAGSVVAEAKEDLALAEGITKAAKFYAEEMSKCLGATAFLAAVVFGVSALESILLLACLRDRSGLLGTNKWQSLKVSKSKPFQAVLMKVRLPQLLAIGAELAWFPRTGMPAEFRRKLSEICGQAAVDKLCATETRNLSLGEYVVAASAGIRNMLHAGRAAEISLELLDYVALLGCTTVLLALGCLLEQPQ